MIHPYDHPLIQRAMQALPSHALITHICWRTLQGQKMSITITTEDAQRFSFIYDIDETVHTKGAVQPPAQAINKVSQPAHVPMLHENTIEPPKYKSKQHIKR